MEQSLKVLAFACLLVLAELSFDCLADDAGLTYPLDGMTEFRIELDGSGECIDDEGRMSLCEENKERNLWRWEGKQLMNVNTKKCLLYVHEGKISLDECSTGGKDTITDTWTCNDNKILANRVGDYALRANNDGSMEAVVDKGKKSPKDQAPSNFNIYIKKTNRPKLMICALWYDMGKRTNDPNYYFFKNEDFRITWPTKYVKFYVIIGRLMYQKMVEFHGENVDAAIFDALVGGVSALDKEYRRMNVRLLLTGYEVWKDQSPINDTDVYGVEKKEVRAYSFNYLRSKYNYDSCIYVHGGSWTTDTGTFFGVHGAGMSDLCKLKKEDVTTEMFIMASIIESQEKFHNLISHEFGHQVFQDHCFEPARPCPFYHMFGTRCTMGGNDQPKGFNINFFSALGKREKKNSTGCVNAKPNLQKIQTRNICGNGIRDPGEECDCGSSQECLTSNPCCDGMICRLKAGAECSNEKCCSKCKMQATGECQGETVILKNATGTIISRASEYNSHRHWRIVAKAGQRILLQFSNLWFDFHINCLYDYIEIRDGGDKSGKLLGKYCSHVNFPPYIISSSNELFITFHADMTFSSKFQIDYVSVDMIDNERKGNFGLKAMTRNSFSLCERKRKTIKCPVGSVIKFTEAKVGNLNTIDCGGSGSSSSTDICVEENSETIVKKKCEGKQTCWLRAYPSYFGEKCNGMYKSIEATYYCDDGAPDKKCIGYDDQLEKLVVRDGTTCIDQFKWLDSYMLYHVGSKRCLNNELKLTHNCYSASNAQFKLLNGQIRSANGLCWSMVDGTIVSDACDTSSLTTIELQ